jgi:quinolinate synthase
MNAQGINLTVLSHPECDAEVLEESDIVGSSEVLITKTIELSENGEKNVMLITECGTVDRILAETKNDLNVIGACVMCKHMKKTHLEDILQSLRNPTSEQIIELDDEIILKAKKSLEEMFRLAE